MEMDTNRWCFKMFEKTKICPLKIPTPRSKSLKKLLRICSVDVFTKIQLGWDFLENKSLILLDYPSKHLSHFLKC